jgi:hypothetical protein
MSRRKPQSLARTLVTTQLRSQPMPQQQDIKTESSQVQYQRFARFVHEYDREGIIYFGQDGSNIDNLSEDTPARESAKLQFPEVAREKYSSTGGRSLRWGYRMRDIPFIPQQLVSGRWRLDGLEGWLLHDLRQHGVTNEDLIDRAPLDLDPQWDERTFRVRWYSRLTTRRIKWTQWRGGLAAVSSNSGKLGKLPTTILNGGSDASHHRLALTREQFLFDVTWTLDLENGVMFPWWNREHQFHIPPPLERPSSTLRNHTAIKNATIVDDPQINRTWLMGQYPHLPQPHDNEQYRPTRYPSVDSAVIESDAESERISTGLTPPPRHGILNPSAPEWTPARATAGWQNPFARPPPSLTHGYFISEAPTSIPQTATTRSYNNDPQYFQTYGYSNPDRQARQFNTANQYQSLGQYLGSGVPNLGQTDPHFPPSAFNPVVQPQDGYRGGGTPSLPRQPVYGNTPSSSSGIYPQGSEIQHYLSSSMSANPYNYGNQAYYNGTEWTILPRNAYAEEEFEED